MLSEIAELINRGIDDVWKESEKATIFEASVNIYNVTKGNSIDTLKKFLGSFKNEFYTEKGKYSNSFCLHFYSKIRARDAYNFIQETPNQFSNVELVIHKKEVGTQGEIG